MRARLAPARRTLAPAVGRAIGARVRPRLRSPMPRSPPAPAHGRACAHGRYELTLPALGADLAAALRAFRPTVAHIATPDPLGAARAAMSARVGAALRAAARAPGARPSYT